MIQSGQACQNQAMAFGSSSPQLIDGQFHHDREPPRRDPEIRGVDYSRTMEPKLRVYGATYLLDTVLYKWPPLLLNCPFCGPSTVRLESRYYISCLMWPSDTVDFCACMETISLERRSADISSKGQLVSYQQPRATTFCVSVFKTK